MLNPKTTTVYYWSNIDTYSAKDMSLATRAQPLPKITKVSKVVALDLISKGATLVNR